MQRRTLLTTAVLAVFCMTAAPAVFAQSDGDVPRRPDGRPDLSGTYDVATLTPLQRPAEFGDRLVLTEEEAAAWVQENCNKPVAGFIAGATAPPGRRMGHAGAIVSGGKGTAAAKKKAMREAGIGVAETPSEMADTLLKMM